MKRSTPSFTSTTTPARASWTKAFSRIITSLILCVSLSSVAQAQQGVGLYSYANSSGTYNALSSGTSWQSGTAVSTDAITNVSLPWSFTYNGKAYNNVWVSNNGFIVFGDVGIGTAVYAPISNGSSSGTISNGYDGAIAAFGSNLVASTVSGASPDISTGSSGGQFVIQYTDMARTGQAANDRMSFQIRLTKVTNVISIVYGTVSTTSTTSTTAGNSGEVGLRGASYYDWKVLTSTTTWSITTATNSAGTAANGTGTGARVRLTSTIAPASGLTYTFTPPTWLSAPTYATLPFTENFDASPWANGNSTQDLPSTASVRSWPMFGDRSIRRNDVTAANAGWVNTTSGSFATGYTTAAARFRKYYSTAASKGYMDFYADFSPTGTKTVSFKLLNNEDTLYVSLSTDGGATFGTPTRFNGNGTNTWGAQSVILGTSTSSTAVVRFAFSSSWGSNTDPGIDDVSITNASCGAVTTSAATGISATGATANWTGGTGSYIIEYGASGFTPGTGATAGTGGTVITAAAGATSAAITGLTANTAYQYYVRQVCSGPTYSTNSTAISFTTPCTNRTLPVLEGFNAAATTPACWSQQNVSGALAIGFVTTPSGTSPTGFTPFEGTRMVYYNSYSNSTITRLVSPPITTTGTSSVDVSFAWYYSSTGTTSTYPTEGVTVQWSTDGSTWNDFTGNFFYRYRASGNGWGNIGLTLPAGAGNVPTLYVGFKIAGNGGYDIYMDSVKIQATPSCLPPTPAATTGITTTGATVNWTSAYTGSYIIEYGPVGFTPGTGATAGGGTVVTAASGATSVALTGLTPGSTYQYYIRQVCSGPSYSANSAVQVFNTACASITSFPWSEGFEGVATTGATVFPNCWTYSNPSGNGGPGTDNGTIVSTTYGGPHAGTKFVYTRWNDTCWIFTPQFTLTGGTTYIFSFWMQNKNVTSPVDFLMSVGYGTSNTPAAMTNVLQSNYSAANNTYQQFSYTFTPSATGTYNFGIKSASATSTPWYLSFDDFGLVELPNCSGTPTAGTAALNSTGSLCTGSPVTLSLTGYSSQGGIGLQWQSSPAGAGTWTDITGATGASYTAAPTASTDYRCAVTCSYSSITKNSNVVSQTVNNPTIASSTGATICGPRTATLTATTGVSTDTAYWYATNTSTTALGSGGSFTTPTLSATTTYYVAAQSPPVSVSVGQTYSGTSNNTTSTGSHGIMFTTTKPMTIVSAKIPFTGTGTITVAVKDASNSTVISTVTSGTVTGLGTTGLTIPLNLSVPAAGNYTLIVNAITGTIGALGYTATNSFPYTTPSGDFSITSGYWYGADADNMYLFNLVVASSCTGARTPVTVTYTTPPAITATPSTTTICNGDSVLATVSGPAYSTFAWTPSATATPSTGASVVLRPTASTTYTVNASGASGGCTNSATVAVTVNPVPPAFTVAPATASICRGTVQSLSASTTMSAQFAFGTQAAQNTATVASTDYPAPYSIYYGGQRMQMLILASELSAAGFSAGSNLTNIQFPVVSRGSNWGSTTTACQNFQVKIGATTATSITTFTAGLTTVVAAGNFTPTVGYTNTHTFATPFVWNGTDNIILETTFSNNVFGSTADVVTQYNSPTAFSSCVVYRADNVTATTAASATTVTYSYSKRPDFKLNGTTIAPITWSPTTELYTDAGATVAYTGAAAGTVYAKPTATRTYTATGTIPSTGCTARATSTITVQQPATATANTVHTATINNNTTYTLHGSTTNSGSYSWSTTGTGVLSATGTLTPVYTPAVGENGTIGIILTANPTAPCAVAVRDTFFLTLNATSNTWRGITSNWFTASNWTSGVVPNSCSAAPVTIPVINAPNVYPVIVGATAQVNNITVASGAQVSISGGQKLGVCGNWVGGTTASATVSGAGSVEFNGTTSQTVSGKNVFATFTVNKTAGTAGFTGTTDISTAFVMTRGNVLVGSTAVVTLKSNASGTAYLDNFTSSTAGTWSGSVTVERYVPNSTIGYRDISSPVTTAKVNDWAADFTVNGQNGVNCWYAYNPYPTLQYYSESTNTPTTDYYGGFISTTLTGNALQSMRGYAARLYTAPLLINTTGIPGTGAMSLGITKTPTSNPAADGWNLMGNPYPSPISWNAVKALNAGKTDGSAYLFQATGEYTGNWATWNGTVGTNGATDQISSTQGFMILASGNNTLNMDNSVRVAATASPFFKTRSVQPDEIRLTLTGGNNSDEIVSYSDPNATPGYDAGYDAAKIAAGSSVYLSFDMPAKELAINVMNQLTETSELPLKIAVTDAGDYTFTATELNITDLTAYLKDAQTGTMTNLATTAPVLHLAGSQYYTGRYSIVFRKSATTTTGVVSVQENQTRIYSYQNKVYITRTNAAAADVEVTNLLGQNVANVKSTTEKTEFELPATEPWYAIVKINENGKVTVQKVLISAAR